MSNSTGTEAIIRNSEIMLDEKWAMYQAPLPGESGVDSQIKASNGFAPLTDEDLEVQIMFVLQKEDQGLNAVGIAGRLNQAPQRIRQWIRDNPGKLKREGAGTGTRFFGT